MTEAENGEAWLTVLAICEPMAEAAAGYRAKLEAAGFSPTAAEAMAVDFHRTLLQATLGQAVKK